MPAAGLDVSDQSVKFSVLERTRHGLGLTHYGEKSIPLGTIDSGVIKDPDTLVTILKTLATEFNLRYIVASLPEEESYIVRLKLPPMKIDQIRESLELQLEEHVPIPPTEAVFDYEVSGALNRPDKGLDVGVSVLPAKTVEAYSEIFQAAGMLPLAFEIEAQAIARAVVPEGDERVSLIVDFGKTRTSFFIASGWTVLFTATAQNIGGEDITRSIQKHLKLDYASAEKLKIEQGLLVSKKNQEVFSSIVPLVSVLRDEIKKQYEYWEAHQQEVGEVDQAISRIILCGGQSTLPGLVDYLSGSVGAPVELGNPWTNVLSFDEKIPDLNLNQALRYTTALGLALRRFKD